MARSGTLHECPQAYNVHYMMADECKELIEHLLMAEDVPKGVNKGKPNKRGQRILHQAVSEGCYKFI